MILRGSGVLRRAKMERMMAIKHLDLILSETDAAMVAGGDLGIEAEMAMNVSSPRRIEWVSLSSSRPRCSTA
jgi:pyruvate kinase